MTSSNLKDRRPFIGAIALVLLVVALVTILLPDLGGSSNDAITAACTRTGALMFALWLAVPDLNRIPPWMWGGLVVCLIVIAVRPRAAIVVLPTLFAIRTIMPKSKPKPKRS